MITLKQFDGSRVKSIDDANFYYMLLQSSGILSGLSVSLTGTNQLNISAGYGFASGRMFYSDAESVSAALSSAGTQKGRLYIHIDLANTSAPAQILTVAAETLPELVQEDLTGGGSIFDIALAEYTATEVQVLDMTYVAPSCSLAGGNENILINANFLNPVNQRGKTSYSTANKYGCDRWRLASGATLSIGSAGVSVTGSIVQPIEGLSGMEGRIFVLSAKQHGGGVQSVSGVLSVDAVQNTGYDMSFVLSGDHVLVTLGGGTWEWAKLEVGEYPSSFSPRPYAEELQACKRYYQYLDGAYNAPIIQVASNYGYAYFKIENMRIKPSVSAGSATAYNSTSGASLGSAAYEANRTYLVSGKAGGLGTGAFISITNLSCDAEIY